MFEVFSREQCKIMDSATINDVGIPSIILMENAAIAVYREILNKGDSFLILCGKGNNGGDALAISRHLVLAGKKVKVYIISKNENYTDDFKLNFNILINILSKDNIITIKSEEDVNENFINDIKKYDVVVDGIFGVGLNRELDNMFKAVIKDVNEYSNIIASIDIPSGLDANYGTDRGISVKANFTYTFEVFKKGFLNYKALNYIGEVKVLKIGVPDYIKNQKTENIYILENEDYKELIPKRHVYGHKGNYGRAVIVAGSVGYTGAAFITTECTVRAGAGITTLLCPEEVQELLSSKLIESMTNNVDKPEAIELIKSSNSIAFGPGIGVEEKEEDLLKKVVDNSICPIIVDADGITLLAKNKELFKKLKGRAIMTPHPGEMARFLGISISEVEDDRVNITQKVAKEYGIVVLLKGYNTVISDGRNTYINPTGNSKMSSGGMGDALTGIINAFLSQGSNCCEAAILGAYIHGRIADILSEKFYIVNARDIIRELPKEINNIIS